RWRVARGGRVAPSWQPGMARGAHTHVAVQEEREPAEHRLLRDRLLAGELLAEAVGEVLVVGHYGVRAYRHPAIRRRPSSSLWCLRGLLDPKLTTVALKQTSPEVYSKWLAPYRRLWRRSLDALERHLDERE